MEEKMKKDESYYMIKNLLDRLNKEGVESFYQSFKKAKMSSGASPYSALLNDIIANCPDVKDWKNPRRRESFEYDIRYYCDYYLTFYDEEN